MTNLSHIDFQQHAAAKALGIDIPPEDQTKIRIRVKSRTHGQVVSGTYVDFGEKTYVIYRAHLGDFEKLIETAPQSDRDFAQRQFEADLRDANGAKAKTEGAEYRKPYDPSYPAAFRSLFRRDLLPFDAVEVVETIKSAGDDKAAAPQQRR